MNGWSKEILSSIILYINPEKIIVFGRGNSISLFTHILNRKNKLLWEKNENASYAQETIKVFDKIFPCLCISTNLGNPKPFTKEKLKEFGYEMRSKV